MEWFRWYHGAISDPKWTIIARKSGQNIGTVVSIWAALLEHASQQEVRGSLEGFDPEVIDALYGYPDGTTVTTCNAMKRHGMLHETEGIISWSRRQPKRDRSDDSSDRVRRYREKQKHNNPSALDDSNASVTPCNATKRHVTPRTEQNRYKEEVSEKLKVASHDSQISLPCEDGSTFIFTESYLSTARGAYPLVDIPTQVEKARAWLLANPTRLKTRLGMTRFLNGWLSRANKDAEQVMRKDAAAAPPVTTGRAMTEQDYAPAPWVRSREATA